MIEALFFLISVYEYAQLGIFAYGVYYNMSTFVNGTYKISKYFFTKKDSQINVYLLVEEDDWLLIDPPRKRTQGEVDREEEHENWLIIDP